MVQLSASSQYLLELINRARLNPSEEANHFGIDLNEGLNPETISSDAKQPLAFNLLLNNAADSHSQWMIDNDTFDHVGANGKRAGNRITDTGYSPRTWSENLGLQGTTGTVNTTTFTESIHQDLFESSEHRQNILKENVREIGLSTLIGDFNGYNSMLVTQNFAASESNPFLTGVVFDDNIKDDNFYSIGEGLANIQITATRQSDNSSFSTSTMSAGGYQLELEPGTYDVTFLANYQKSTSQIIINTDNIKLDLNTENLPNLSDHNQLYGSVMDDLIQGEDGNDTLVGNAGNDTLDGGAGSDRLYVIVDNDIILDNHQVTGDGTDIFANIEQANLYGRQGDNFIDASQSTQIKTLLKGYNGNDDLRGSQLNDTILGGNGNDTLVGNAGNDVLNGGTGSDRLYVIVDNDIILDNHQVTGDGTDSLFNIEQANLYGRQGNNFIDASQSTQIKTLLKGYNGNDDLRGSQLNDTILGGNGSDTLVGNAGNDVLNGGTGSDRLYVIVDNDIILDNHQVTGDGTDSLFNIEQANLYGRQGDNFIDASQSTQIKTLLKGYNGNDDLRGSQLNDTILGGNGNDTLLGNGGQDTLEGGNGTDIFVLQSEMGRDIINDFADGTDYFALDSSLTFNDLSIANTSVGTSTLIKDINTNSLIAIVDGITATSITAEDFITT